MALKDWEKAREDKWAITYNKINSLKHLNIARSKDVIIGYKVKTPYITWVAVYSGDPIFLKGAKTKAQAIKFAKQYMRKH